MTSFWGNSHGLHMLACTIHTPVTRFTCVGIDMDNPDSSMWIKLYKMAVSKWMWCSWMHLLPSWQTGYPTNTRPYYLQYTILSQLEPWLQVGLAVHSASCWMGGSCNNGFNLVKDKKIQTSQKPNLYLSYETTRMTFSYLNNLKISLYKNVITERAECYKHARN